MLSRAKSLDGIFILRPFSLSTIQCHPSQDVRAEYKRLDILSHQTTMNLGTTAEASESQTGGNGGARRLAALQATMSRLIGGQPATVPARRRQNVRRRPNVRVQAESKMDIETVATVPRPQKRRAEEEEPMRHASLANGGNSYWCIGNYLFAVAVRCSTA
ncbi:hypothetical protein R3P38DRAFT_3240903 [Favolaschia claudopus]|uniref:Uncharacterized protein n=1 Tax=Favolaschia claudopus TaxID=2862362 RepID=A0AAV9Z5Z9_9AGAR